MANSSLTHINQIEGLISGVQEHLEAITVKTAEQAEVKDAAVGKLASWEKNQLFELRKEYEK